MTQEELSFPWDRVRVLKNEKGEIVLNARQYEEIRKAVQMIETIVDGATQQKDVDMRRLSMALSTIRSIQSLYFPQLNYSLYYFRSGNKIGEQHPSKQNYRKWKKEKDLEKVKKLTDESIKGE